VRDEFVLDASALLSILLSESGNDRVHGIVEQSRIHAVNLAEVIGRLVRSGVPPETARQALAELHLEVEDQFGVAEADFCGLLLGTRRDLGLSLGDCVCLTLAGLLGAVAVTADRRWKALDGVVVQGKPLRVELIR
jgi:PIN domain nuclease of toxin-antitoxin system